MVRAVAIILAAGMSSRMGQCKATLPWRTDLTLLAYQIQEFRTVDVVPIVVLGAHNAHLRQAANIPSTACVTINPTPSQGKVSSIFQGLRCLPEQWDVVFISA
ncbi:MAG: NTP transferase domain-containing protein, partial [Cyanobacteria bacterium J06626_14]